MRIVLINKPNRAYREGVTTDEVFINFRDYEIIRGGEKQYFAPRLMFKIVVAALVTPGFISSTELVQFVYGHDPNGGPLWATSSVQAALVKIKRRLRRLSLNLTRLGYSGYYVEDLLKRAGEGSKLDLRPQTLDTPTHIGESRTK